MNKTTNYNILLTISILFSFTYVLILYGALPFISIPTLGQAFWTTGFAQSMANQSLFSIYATNIGNPEPAAMAFGLSGAYITSILIRLGIEPSNAYSFMHIFWLSIAFFGSYRLSVLFKVNQYLSVATATLWLSCPIGWWHTGYSMVALGIALLPFYFWSFMQLFYLKKENKKQNIKIFLISTASLIVSIFMDGYTFMMFIVGSSILGFSLFIIYQEKRKSILQYSFPIYVLGIIIAYILFAGYIGKSTFNSHSMDFFRAWGIDLTFLLQPTKGIYWFWDYLNLSISRSGSEFFGDASVWKSTFALPLLVLSIFAWKKVRQTNRLATPFLIIALFGLYMSLGPSLKYNSTKPESVKSVVMDEKYAIVQTGSALISSNLPGFKVMRASYRWSALAYFAFWFIIVLYISSMNNKKDKWRLFGIIILLIILNSPNIHQHLTKKINHFKAFNNIESTLIEDLRKTLKEDEQVAFLPWRNDFFVNYLASRIKVNTYNIGGDKNLLEARKSWPQTMKRFKMGKIDSSFTNNIVLVLLRNEADVVILPYIDMLWAAHSWPAPLKYKDKLLKINQKLKNIKYIAVEENNYYSSVRISKELQKLDYEDFIVNQFVKFPFVIENKNTITSYVLKSGWHSVESKHVWSKEKAELQLPILKSCKKNSFFVLEFDIFNASKTKSKEVIILNNRNELFRKNYINANANSLLIPIDCKKKNMNVNIEIPRAEKPSLISKSKDNRLLGIALKKISIKEGIK